MVVLLFVILTVCGLVNAATWSVRRPKSAYVTPIPAGYIFTDSLQVSTDIELSTIHKFDSLNHKSKRTVCRLCRLSGNQQNCYYNVSPSTLALILLIRSIIPKIDELHLLARLTNAAAIAIMET